MADIDEHTAALPIQPVEITIKLGKLQRTIAARYSPSFVHSRERKLAGAVMQAVREMYENHL
jgi:hypothetical protein